MGVAVISILNMAVTLTLVALPKGNTPIMLTF
jgi:hypothetical protein